MDWEEEYRLVELWRHGNAEAVEKLWNSVKPTLRGILSSRDKLTPEGRDRVLDATRAAIQRTVEDNAFPITKECRFLKLAKRILRKQILIAERENRLRQHQEEYELLNPTGPARTELFKRIGDKVRKTVYRDYPYLPERDWDDVWQETLVAAIQGFRLQGGGSLSTWCVRTARNKAVDILRRRARDNPAPAAWNEEIPPHDTSQREDQQIVHEAVLSLIRERSEAGAPTAPHLAFLRNYGWWWDGNALGHLKCERVPVAEIARELNVTVARQTVYRWVQECETRIEQILCEKFPQWFYEHPRPRP
jgi:RNA polymerase sigma factor (sigma-70 family)